MAKLEEIIRNSFGENCPLFHLDECDPNRCDSKLTDDTCDLDCCAKRAAAALREAGMVELAGNQTLNEDKLVEAYEAGKVYGEDWWCIGYRRTMSVVNTLLTPVPVGNGEEEVWAKIRRKAGK